MKNLSTRTLVALVVAPALLILAIGFILPSDSYVASLLANIGSALLLAAPLIIFERRLTESTESTEQFMSDTGKSIELLENRFDEVGSSIADVDRRLEDLAAQTRSAVVGQREEELARVLEPRSAMVQNPSYQTIYRAVKECSSKAPFVPLKTEKLILRFHPVDTRSGEALRVRVLRNDEVAKVLSVPPRHTRSRAYSHDWKPGESLEDLFKALDKIVRTQFGGDFPLLDSGPVISGLADYLEFDALYNSPLIKGRKSLLAIPAPHWAIYSDHLEHVGNSSQAFSAEEVIQAGSEMPSSVLEADILDSEELPYVWQVALRCFADDRFLMVRVGSDIYK